MPIGAATLPADPHSIEGSQPLTSITTSVRDRPGAAWRPAHRIQLQYELRTSVLHYPVPAPDPALAGQYCTQAPLRYLASVQHTAYASDGHATPAPKMTFGYNQRRNAVTVPSPQPPPPVSEPGFGYYGTEYGAVGHLLDLDADGIRDRVAVRESDSRCVLIWQRGRAGGGFDGLLQNSPLPTTAWHRPRHYGEGCTFNGQVAYRDQYGHLPSTRGIVSYHFLDYTGDGRVDLLTNVWAEADHETYQPVDDPTQHGPTISPADGQIRSVTAGYHGARAGIYTPIKLANTGGGTLTLTLNQKAYNQLQRGLRAPGERGFALLTRRWTALKHITISPSRITTLIRAALALTHYEHGYTPPPPY